MHVGFLSPSSKVYPGIGFEFMDGLKACLKAKGLADDAIRFTLESVSFGGEEKAVYLAAEKLLMTEGVDVLVAYIDERVLEMMKPLVYASGKLLIVVNPGANYPVNWIAQENVIHLTLLHSFLCWLSGADAATKSSAAGTSSTFYDCGYLHAAAMMNSFIRHEGNVLFNDVNNQLYNDQYHMGDLIQKMDQFPDGNTLLCVSDTWPASALYKQLDRSANLFVSPMMLQPAALEAIPANAAFTVQGYQSWFTAADTPANTAFKEAYAQRSKKEPTIFSLLGWETGLILHHMLTALPNDYSDGPVVAEALKKVNLDSPRGELQLDGETLYYTSPVYQLSAASGEQQRKTVSRDEYASEWKIFTSHHTTGAVSGWTNTYLCY